MLGIHSVLWRFAKWCFWPPLKWGVWPVAITSYRRNLAAHDPTLLLLLLLIFNPQHTWSDKILTTQDHLDDKHFFTKACYLGLVRVWGSPLVVGLGWEGNDAGRENCNNAWFVYNSNTSIATFLVGACVCTVYWKSSGVLCNVWLLTSLSEHCSVQVRCVLSDHQSAVCLLNWEERNQLWKVNHHHTSFNNDFPIQTIQLCQDTNLGICLPFWSGDFKDWI